MMARAFVLVLLALAAWVPAVQAQTYLKQSTAVDVKLGPFVDSADGVTAETGLTISQADVRLAKNNGNWGQKNQSSSCTHEENGWYECSLDATDTNTLGILVVAVNESGALPVWKTYTVVPADFYDGLITGAGRVKSSGHYDRQIVVKKGTTGYLMTVCIEAVDNSGALTGLAFNTSGLTGYYTRADQGNAGATAITLATMTRGTWASGGFVEKDSTNTPCEYELGVPDAVLAAGSAWATVTLKGAANMKPVKVFVELVDNTVADAYARLGAPAGASIAADIAGVQSDTNDIQTRLPAALVSGRMDASVGAMASGVLTATAIASDAITAAKVADGTIDAATFAANAIDATAIAANAITAAKIADGAIDAATFAANAIDATAIAANAITAAKIANDAITDAKVASDVTIASVTGSVNNVTSMATYRKNVGSQRTYPIYMVDSSGVAVTGQTVTVTVSKDGASFGSATGTVAEIANGLYAYSPSQADTNCDTCVYRATATGAVQRIFYFMTVP